MVVTGRYKKDQNFTTICKDGTVYTVARRSGDWRQISVGEYTFFGKPFTEEMYSRIESECDKTGIFVLDD